MKGHVVRCNSSSLSVFNPFLTTVEHHGSEICVRLEIQFCAGNRINDAKKTTEYKQ